MTTPKRSIFLPFIALLIFQSPLWSMYGACDYIKSIISYDNILYSYNLTKSLVSFYPSFTYNKIKYGNAYSFDMVMPPKGQSLSKTPLVVRDENNQVQAIYDGKDTPILLGGIPFSQEHIDGIRHVIEAKAFIIASFNLDFERRWSNWRELKKANSLLDIKIYPTVDYTAPDRVDLVRFIIDLFDRKLAILAQCKAGKGRSATGIGAYLLTISFMANDVLSIDDIEHYLRTLRPRVDFNPDHRRSLDTLRAELLLYDGDKMAIIAHLKQKYAQKIIEREREIVTNFSLIWQQ